MIPAHFKSLLVFTPAEPQERTVPREEGVPLHAIDRRLWPGMRVGGGEGERGREGEREPVHSLHIVSPSPPLPISPSPTPTDRDVSPTERNRGGRPRAITPQRRVQLLHILRRGQSRRYAAMEMGIDAASITRAVRRDPRLAIEVAQAEREGEIFLEIYDRLYSQQDTILAPGPVVSTPELELEKQYLIACGLPASFVSRLRLRTMDDPLPADLPPDPPLFMQKHKEVRVRPWKKGRRRKKVRVDLW